MTSNDVVKKRASARLDAFISSGDLDDFPADFSKVLEISKVKDVAFEKMLGGGILLASKANGDFIIKVNSGTRDPEELRKDFYNNLGKNLPENIRFTIAHEIAHILHYRNDSKGYIEDIPFQENESERAVNIDEDFCNKLALKLLISDAKIKDYSSHGYPWTPHNIRSFSKRLGVSDIALIERLGEVFSLPNNISFTGYSGAIVLFRVNEERLEYISHAASSEFKVDLFKNPRFGTDFRKNLGLEKNDITRPITEDIELASQSSSTSAGARSFHIEYEGKNENEHSFMIITHSRP